MNVQERQAIRQIAADHDLVIRGRAIRAARDLYGHKFPRWMIDLAVTAQGSSSGMTPAVPGLASAVRAGHVMIALCGPSNTGKTFAALRWASKHEAQWLPASDMPDRWDETKAAMVTATRAAYLVVDDLFGPGSGGPVALDCARVIMARRYDARLPTVITTSLCSEDLSSRLGTQHSRIHKVDVEPLEDGQMWTMTGSPDEGDNAAHVYDLLRACRIYTDDEARHMDLVDKLGLTVDHIQRTAASINDTDTETLTVLKEIVADCEQCAYANRGRPNRQDEE